MGPRHGSYSPKRRKSFLSAAECRARWRKAAALMVPRSCALVSCLTLQTQRSIAGSASICYAWDGSTGWTAGCLHIGHMRFDVSQV